jgi:hypothetical protein
VLLKESSSNSVTSIVLACVFAAGLMMSVAALVTTIVIMCYRKRVTVVKQDFKATPELATPIATDLLPKPNYENNNIITESSLEHISTDENIAYEKKKNFSVMESSLNTGENIAYNCVVNA